MSFCRLRQLPQGELGDDAEAGWQSPSLQRFLNGPFGLCQAEAFRNSFADSVSFHFPSWYSHDGGPVPPANCALGLCHPCGGGPQ
jgi:hypothetical protein